MPVDTSIYNNIQTPPSPIQTIGSMAQTLGALNQNRLFQQQYNANVAAGQAAKANVDAQGNLNIPGYTRDLAGGAANYLLPDFIQKAQQMQQGQLGIDKTKLDIATQSLKNINDGLGSMLSLRDAQGNFIGTQKDVIGRIGELVSQGSIPMQTAISEMQSLPQGGAELQQWLTQHMVQNLDSQAKLQAMMPAPVPVQTGGQTHFIQSSPIGGVHDVAVIQNTLSPGEAASRIPVAAGGVQGTVPLSSIVTPTGQALPPQGQQQPPMGAPASNVPVASPPAGTQPGQPQMVPQGMAPQVPPQTPPGGPAPPGFVQSQLAPGVAAAADVAATGSANAWQTLRNDAGGTSTRIYQLGQALKGLQGSPTGPGTEEINNIKSFISAQSPDMLKKIGLNPDVNQIKSYDEANKYLTAFASSQAGAMGAGTDSKLATALSANASTHISNLAAQDVVKANIGLERAKQAQASAFQASRKPPQDFSDWQVQWNKDTDPRAFIVDQMTPKERSVMIKSMKPSEQNKFLKSVRMGLDTGVLSMADIQATQNGAQ